VDQENASYLLQIADLHGASILKAFCTNFILKQLDTIDTRDLGEYDDLTLQKTLKRIKLNSSTTDDEEEEENNG